MISVQKENEQAHILHIPKEDVESAIRQWICEQKPEYAKDWILNPKYNIADVLFAGTKL